MMATKGRPIFGSLWFRLIGAFAVVIGVMLLVVVLVTRGVTERQFDQYLSQRDALFVRVRFRHAIPRVQLRRPLIGSAHGRSNQGEFDFTARNAPAPAST